MSDLEPWLVYPDPPPPELVQTLELAGHAWKAVPDEAAVVRRDGSETTWRGAVIVLGENPEAGLAQVLLYRTQGTYDQHLGDVEKICKAALDTTDICYVELATVYQKRAQPDQQAALIQQLKAPYGRGIVPATRVDSVARVLARPSASPSNSGKMTPKPFCHSASPEISRRFSGL